MNIDLPPDLPWYVQWIRNGFFVLLAAVAGCLSYVLRSMDNGARPRFWRGVVEGASAGVAGFLVLLACQAMHVGQEWTGFIVGLCGWIGANATIQVVQRLAWNKLGLNGSQNDEPSK
jgi:hypothetical protein